MKPCRHKIDLLEVTYEAIGWFIRYVMPAVIAGLLVVLVVYNCFLR